MEDQWLVTEKHSFGGADSDCVFGALCFGISGGYDILPGRRCHIVDIGEIASVSGRALYCPDLQETA